MEFESIDVSALGPFTEEQVLLFHDGLNLIKGPHGSGKTTIFQELQDQYRGLYQRHDVPAELAAKLVFIGEGYAHDVRRGESIVAAGSSLSDAPCIRLFSQLISHHINQLIAPKITWGRSKFGEAKSCGYPFYASIVKSGGIEVLNTAHRAVDDLFLAMGETFLLSLACNFALRDVLGFHDPLVVDGAFGFLDESVFAGCYEGLARTKTQCIYLLSEASSERVPLNPDYVLTRVKGDRTRAIATSGRRQKSRNK